MPVNCQGQNVAPDADLLLSVVHHVVLFILVVALVLHAVVLALIAVCHILILACNAAVLSLVPVSHVESSPSSL
jgi:hypothetical protein